MPVKEKDKKGRLGTDRFRLGERIQEIRTELRKVAWPTRQETINLTVIVIAVSAAVGMFLGLVDFGVAQMFQVILR